METLVFVDVSPLGYVLADRVRGLDEKHCKLVFEKLAEFHAASMVLAKEVMSVETKKGLIFSQET